MNRVPWRHLRAILMLPGMVLLVIPGCLLLAFPVSQPTWPRLTLALLSIAGTIALLCGVALMVATIRLFARYGDGTLSPWDATTRLVVRGIYRHVRNPMISGVFLVLLGESLLLRALCIVGWFLVAIMLNLIYIPLIEEPGLERRFGDAWLSYKRHVPRWLPRLRPWDPERDISAKTRP